MDSVRTVIPTRVIPLRHGDREEAGGLANFGRVVAPDQIDWPVVKEWFSSCFAKHKLGGKELGSRGSLDNLSIRVIDVDKACVVVLPEGAPYIALSYTWGKDQALKLTTDNISLLSSPGCFNSAACRPSWTIVDAIHAVRNLGFHFLWTDALCIVQDDPDNIQANVDHMRQIYTDAIFTIVAASGSDADSGLPGVCGDRPRPTAQKRCAVDGITMVNQFDIHVNDSRWNTRGWTFQERVLSSRLLIFSPSQVLYHCDMGCDEEEQFHTRHNGAQFRGRDPAHQLDFDHHDIFSVYAGALAEYTKRYITEPMDKIRAFDGVLELLQGPFQGPFFFGLPASMFDVGLLWIPSGRCRRRRGTFPSWSWSGWDGAVRYTYLAGGIPMNLCECTVSQCSIETAAGINLCSRVVPIAADRYDNAQWTRHFDKETLEIYYRNAEEKLRSYKYPRVPRALSNERGHLLSREVSTVLHIRGRAARFHLTGQHSDLEHTCYDGRHYRCSLAILDEKGQVAGRIVVDAHTVPELQNRDHMFLALSRSTLYNNDEDPAWDTKTNGFTKRRSQFEYSGRPMTESYGREFANRIAEAPLGVDDGSPLLSEPGGEWSEPDYLKRGDNGVEGNGEPFNNRLFNSKVWWPLINVILLSDETDGIVERRGIGQIHIDAFNREARSVSVFLG